MMIRESCGCGAIKLEIEKTVALAHLPGPLSQLMNDNVLCQA